MSVNDVPAHEIGVVLLSTSFGVAVVLGGLVGWLGGMRAGFAAGALAVAAMSLVAAWLTGRAGPQPNRGFVRVEGTVTAPSGAARSPEPVIRFTDASGAVHELPGAHAPGAAIGARVTLDYPEDHPEQAQVANVGLHRTLLMVFLLFGVVPLLMSAVMLVSIWEGPTWTAAARSPAVETACRWARIAANLALLAGVAATFLYEDVGGVTRGFPISGAAAAAHGVIGAVAGMRPSMVLAFFVIAAGFIGFGLFARSVGGS